MYCYVFLLAVACLFNENELHASENKGVFCSTKTNTNTWVRKWIICVLLCIFACCSVFIQWKRIACKWKPGVGGDWVRPPAVVSDTDTNTNTN